MRIANSISTKKEGTTRSTRETLIQKCDKKKHGMGIRNVAQILCKRKLAVTPWDSDRLSHERICQKPRREATPVIRGVYIALIAFWVSPLRLVLPLLRVFDARNTSMRSPRAQGTTIPCEGELRCPHSCCRVRPINWRIHTGCMYLDYNAKCHRQMVHVSLWQRKRRSRARLHRGNMRWDAKDE